MVLFLIYNLRILYPFNSRMIFYVKINKIWIWNWDTTKTVKIQAPGEVGGSTMWDDPPLDSPDHAKARLAGGTHQGSPMLNK